MEKRYKCVGCSEDFRVLCRRDKPVHRQHEVEMNVECPYCSKTNAIVWPQDESLPLVVPIDAEKPRVKSAPGDFYVQAQCCTSCGVPQAVAPDLVGWTNETHPQCYWIKQPQTSDELDRAIKIIHSQELGCHRYSGTDQAILRRLPAEDCDHLRPDLKLKSQPYFASSGGSPKFTLSASAEGGLLSKVWRRLGH
jgi:DNA-directed RNA polymerase subunit RPC12/RpoP